MLTGFGGFFLINFTQERFLTSIRKIIPSSTILSDVITLGGPKITHLSDLELLNILLNLKNHMNEATPPPRGEHVDKMTLDKGIFTLT